MAHSSTTNGIRAAGYDALIAEHKLQVLRNWHHSAIGGTVYRTHVHNGEVFDV
jgi:hypothetical protein